MIIIIIMIMYDKKREIKFKPRIKLNHNIDVKNQYN